VLRELFVIPGLNLPVYGYGLMLVVAVLLALRLAKFIAPRFGIDPEHFVTLAFIALFAGIVGARASHILENWSTYTDPTRSVAQNVKAMVNLQQGGLTYYGGFLLGLPSCVAYGIWKKMPVLRSMDVSAPCLMVGLGVGRIGCFLNGCCWGALCAAPWAVQFPYESPPYVYQVEKKLIAPPAELLVESVDGTPGVLTRGEVGRDARLALLARGQHSLPIHPVQIYSLITALLIAGACTAMLTLSPRPGLVFAVMMVLEGAGRFCLELLRVEPAVAHINTLNLSVSMVIGLCLIVTGALFGGYLLLRGKSAS